MLTHPGPVRLTREDWRVIYEALGWLNKPAAYACRRVLRRIGYGGMAARDRGVARVKRRRG